MAENAKAVVTPLPTSLDGWVLKSGLKKTLNDEVQVIHERLLADPKLSDQYVVTLTPVSDEDSPEGWLADDEIKSANMIRDYARVNKYPRVASQTLKAIRTALNVVLRKYGLSRKQRRFTVDGTIVPPPANANDE